MQCVMAGLVPATHVLLGGAKDVGARHKAGHDDGETVHSTRMKHALMARERLPTGTHVVGMVGYAPLVAADLLERVWAALTHPTGGRRQQKSPVRFPARAQFVSFNFVNNLIWGIVSSNTMPVGRA
jgi:hypothetical protein